MVTQCGVCPSGVRGHFARFPPAHILAPSSCRRPSAKRRRLGGLRRTTPRRRRTLLEARRRARQSIREYELIWLLQQRLRAVSWPHWRLRCFDWASSALAWSLSSGERSARVRRLDWVSSAFATSWFEGVSSARLRCFDWFF